MNVRTWLQDLFVRPVVSSTFYEMDETPYVFVQEKDTSNFVTTTIWFLNLFQIINLQVEPSSKTWASTTMTTPSRSSPSHIVYDVVKLYEVVTQTTLNIFVN